MTKQLLLEKISKEEIKKHIKDFYKYAKKHLDIDKNPKVIFENDKENAEDFFGKTGYYDPKSMSIHLFVVDRHAKDIVRSFAHELIHHFQNLEERLPDEIMSKTHDIDYAAKNKDLRDMEREAYEKGNLLFRDWTDSLKKKRGKQMNEGKKIIKKTGTGKKRFPKQMSMDKAKEKGIPPEADVTGDGAIQGWEAGRAAARSAAMNKTKQRKMEESTELQEADPRLKKVLTQQERTLNDYKTKREQNIYNELMARILKQGK